MDWIKDTFGVTKPVIAMVHLEALPGDPAYDPAKGMAWVVARARQDLLALQNGGVDAVMFSNERSLPYLTKVDTVTVACMARVVAELDREIEIPYGVNVLWDPIASLDLAVAVGAKFVREIFTGVYASDFGLWNTDCGEVIRHQHAIHGQDVKLLFNIFPESAVYLGERDPESIARSTVFNTRPDGLCVSGLTAGAETDSGLLQRIKAAVPGTPIFANTGVTLATLEEKLAIADGVIVGTALKRDGHTWNEVDPQRAREFMRQAREVQQRDQE
jgi:uncharacterized protein